jgi:hypothetical protein
MWNKIKKGIKVFFEILNVISPLLIFVSIIWYLTKYTVTLRDLMWFAFFLVVYGTDRIVDAIKELKKN